jgi:hypothetical protein
MSDESKSRILLWLFILFLCVCSFFVGRVARADTIDNFTFAIPHSFTFTWTLPATVHTSAFSFGEFAGWINPQDIFFECVAPTCAEDGIDPMTDYWEHFSQPIMAEVNNVLLFIPGSYQAPFDWTDNYGATLTIAPVSTPESRTRDFLLVFAFLTMLAMALFPELRRAKR